MSDAAAGIAEMARKAADVIVLEIGARYVSPECQCGAHWGCPGGTAGYTQDRHRVRVPCQCSAPECSCVGPPAAAPA